MKKLLSILLLSISFSVSAQTLTVGAALPTLSLNDQHDQVVTTSQDLQMILFAGEKGTSELMTKVLEGLPPSTLKDKKAIYIADISGMPGFITKMVALPRMQKLPYQIALIRDAKEVEWLPKKPQHVTIIKIQQGKIAAIDYFIDANQINQLLK